MSENKDYSNAAINALYGAEPIGRSTATAARPAKGRVSHHTVHNRHQPGFEKKAPINLYSLIFAVCAAISMLTYFVAK
jgi:hypothetical protein